MVREVYTPLDFDFALGYLPEKDLFYVFPVSVFISYASEIHLVEADKRNGNRVPPTSVTRGD